MNQPTGICFTASWVIGNRSLHQFHPDESFQGHDLPSEAHQPPSLVDQLDIDHPSPSVSCSESLPPYDDYDPSINTLGDVEMDMPDQFDNKSQDQQKFTEAYQGCSEVFIGGSTFMDLFWQDKHAEEWQMNLYFPFTSCDEWDFVSWCLRSGLSMAAIDSLLSLNVVSQLNSIFAVAETGFQIKKLSLSFKTSRDLQAQVKTLPARPKWLCEQMEPESHTK